MTTDSLPEQIRAMERPHRALWTYYVITALLTGPGVIIMLPYLFFRYHTLRYRFDEEGVHMKVGLLFRREVNLTYARIQDIHLRSGILQRWLGLANVEVQTASGSANAELVVEGFKEFEALRDFLYGRMRGTREPQTRPTAATAQSPSTGATADLVPLLLSIRDELHLARVALEQNRPQASGPSTPTRNV